MQARGVFANIKIMQCNAYLLWKSLKRYHEYTHCIMNMAYHITLLKLGLFWCNKPPKVPCRWCEQSGHMSQGFHGNIDLSKLYNLPWLDHPYIVLTVASYTREQNLFLHMHSMAFSAFKSLQPSSNTSVTFSSSPRSSNPAVTSAILFISTSLSLTSPSHLNAKCLTFSTSHKPH